MKIPRLRVIIVAAIVVAGTSAMVVLVPPRQGHGAQLRPGAEAGEEHEATRTIHGVTCGYERWPVKTLTDPGARRIDFAVHPATVRYLGSLPASPGGRDSRSPLESRVFGVQARVVGVKREADSDYHLILSEGGATMIAEMPGLYVGRPAPLCNHGGAGRARARGRRPGRRVLDPPGPAGAHRRSSLLRPPARAVRARPELRGASPRYRLSCPDCLAVVVAWWN